MIKVESRIVNEEELIAQLGAISKKAVPAAIGAALSRAATTTRANAQRTIRQSVTLKAGVVREGIKIQRTSNSRANRAALAITTGEATDPRLAVRLVATGSPLPMRDYQTAMTKRGATFRVTKGAPRKVYRREGAAAFIPGRRAQSSSVKTRRVSSRFSANDRFGGHMFVRTGPNPPGPKQAPIKKVYGPGIAQRFRARKVQKVVRDTFGTEYPKRLRHELTFRIQRLTGST